ncbi:MAG: methylated-DNA--[protein]-cysteine S-methyltransferase [Pseudomonadota bacterium]
MDIMIPGGRKGNAASGGGAVSLHVAPSPLGPLKVAIRQGQLMALALAPASSPRDFVAGLAKRLSGVQVRWGQPSLETDRLLAEISRQLGLYFARLRSSFELPLAPAGTPFQRRVWTQLLRIPYGEVRAYGEVGAALGDRRLARAVGGACRDNPLPVVIPCHRVVPCHGTVGHNGGLGGYSGGPEMKRLLLGLEKPGAAAHQGGGKRPEED